MSIEAMKWALEQQLPPGRAAAKHVLTIIANQANLDPRNSAQHIAYPSIDYLVWATGQNRKTVIANMKLLVEWKLIEDTGRRLGRTRQIPIYRVNCGPDLFHEQSQNRNRSNIGTVSQEPPQAPAGKGTDIGTVPKSEQYRIPPETVPILGHGTKSITSCGEDARERALAELPTFERQLVDPYLEQLPSSVEVSVFANFVKHRNAMRRTLTLSAWLEVAAELRRLEAEGVDLNESLRLTMRRSWTDPADPRKPQRGGAPPRARPSANDDFSRVNYQGTADDDLPAELRESAATG